MKKVTIHHPDRPSLPGLVAQTLIQSCIITFRSINLHYTIILKSIQHLYPNHCGDSSSVVICALVGNQI